MSSLIYKNYIYLCLKLLLNVCTSWLIYADCTIYVDRSGLIDDVGAEAMMMKALEKLRMLSKSCY